MTYEAWFATNPICARCGSPLTSNYDSFRVCMKRFGRPPLHCHGHNQTRQAPQYAAEYKAFRAEKHLCACGCGEIIQPSYRTYVASMRNYGRPPLRIQQHRKGCFSHNKERVKKELDTLELNGCTIIRADHGRCEKSYHCDHYESCLDAAEKRWWGGWRTT